jgi:siroheme synthase-like protein
MLKMDINSQSSNQLFPVFLKLNQLKVLLIGAGPVGLEKLTALLGNAPQAFIRIIAIDILPEIAAMAAQFEQVLIEHRPYRPSDMQGYDFTIIAVNNRTLSEEIYGHAKVAGILANVADTPDLCDFYLGSIVQKGNLKIAISTNGKSPTMAKRLRELLQEIIPDETDNLLENMHQARKHIKADFNERVRKLNALTYKFKTNKIVKHQ